MELDPAAVPERPVPRAGPTRVLRARPSAEELRASGRGLLLVGAVCLLLSLPFFLAAADLATEFGFGSGPLRVTLLGVPIAGYGLVCVVRGVRMRRAARAAAAEKAGI